MKFCIGVGVPDVITHANLGDDRFRVSEGAWVEFPTFPLTCVVVLKTHWHFNFFSAAAKMKSLKAIWDDLHYILESCLNMCPSRLHFRLPS